MAVESRTALPGTRFSFDHGNQINKEDGRTFGYNVVFNYNNTFRFYDSFQQNFFLKDNNRDNTELQQQETINGVVAVMRFSGVECYPALIKKAQTALRLCFCIAKAVSHLPQQEQVCKQSKTPHCL
jgi:hypothetical protein